jgi:hypothetical protein
MLVLLVGCAEEPVLESPEVDEVFFAGRYSFELVDRDLAWFDGEVVISGPEHAVRFDFGEAAYDGTADADRFAFAGDDAAATGSVYSNALSGEVTFEGDPTAYAFLAERVLE